MIDRPRLPIGTQVVTRTQVAESDAAYPEGSVPVVMQALDDRGTLYRVRLLDGTELTLQREHLTVRKEVQRAGLAPGAEATPETELYQYVNYRRVFGSRAYGL